MPYKDPEKAREYRREWKKSPEQRAKAAERRRKREAEDPEFKARSRETEKRWRDRNKDKVAAKNKRRQSDKQTYRDDNLKHLYGITHADYERMLEEQGGGCAICGSPTPRRKGRGHLSVDHCHKTGVVRGVLCDPCNNGLGRFQDDPNLLRKAIEYLERER